jgi:hypothetical protein
MIIPLILLYSTLWNPNIIMTNIVNNHESILFTSKLHHSYNIDKNHIIYFGDKYDLPITTVSLNNLILNQEKKHPKCNTDSFYLNYLLNEKNLKLTCIQENKISNIIEALQKSNEKYEIIFDDSFWLQDHSFYRLLKNKNIKRILQLDLENDNIVNYPFFVDEIIYYYDKFKNNI